MVVCDLPKVETRVRFPLLAHFFIYMFDLKKLILSFGHAVNGVKAALDDQSFRIQVVIGAVVFALAFYFRLQKFEFLILILTVISVLTLEMINTSIERILDLLHPEKHPEIKIIKDISAAAVLLAALGALVIGLKIFIPYVF